MKKFFTVFVASLSALSLLPVMSSEAAENENRVHVIVENTTFTPDSEDWDESFWYGTLVDTWVTLKEDSTAMTCVADALEENGFSQTGAENSYITEINGLGEYDGGSMSGWSGTLNDWFANEGLGNFRADNGKLENGDEIRIMYSLAWGSDLGSDWSSNDTTIKSVDFSSGKISPDFDKDIHEYTIELPEDTETVKITPTASNKNYQVRTRIGDTVYKRTADVPVNDSDEITVECSFTGSVSMNGDGEPQVYTFTVKKNSAEKYDVRQILSDSAERLTAELSEPSFGNEWAVLGLARYGIADNGYFEGYYERALETACGMAEEVNMNGALSKTKSTENSRFVLALSAIGKNPEEGRFNFIKPYNNFSWIKKQGLNGTVWSLIALDSHGYGTEDESIRSQCIDYILENESEGGGWSFGGKTADPDMTAAAIIALSRYTDDERVKETVGRAVEVLSETQTETGGYASSGGESSESVSQVITALCSVGINPHTDKRFIKNGISLIDSLVSYYNEETNDFRHTPGGDGNAMATEQAIYALAAYERLINGQSPLYDMNDVEFEKPDVTVTTSATTEATTTTDTTTTTVTTTAATSSATSATTEKNTDTSVSAASTTTGTTAETLPDTGNNSPLEAVLSIIATLSLLSGASILRKKDD